MSGFGAKAMAARNIIYWNRIKTFRDALAVVTATAMGAGLFPRAPGTMGTLVALPLAYATRGWPIAVRLAIWGGLTVAGTWGAKVFDELMGTGDNQCIVMDEVVGLGITSWSLSGIGTAPAWVTAFFLFRFFDIVKIFPVRLVDSWSKKKAKENSPLAKWWGGFGVMADDILAGLQGLAVMLVLQKLHVFLN
jgi:phosphatidylglycerophosphatase A